MLLKFISNLLGDNAQDFDALIVRGYELKDRGSCEEALLYFDRALALRPDDRVALTARGLALNDLNRFEDALACHEKALAVSSRNLGALCNSAMTLNELAQYEEAFSRCTEALQRDPSLVQAYMHRCIALTRMHRPLEALADCETVVAQIDTDLAALNVKASILQELGRYPEAVQTLERALEIHAHDGQTRFNLSLVHLRLGNWKVGWALYESRFDVPNLNLKRALSRFSQPLWRGESDLNKKVILLSVEQGHGDTIAFSRFCQPLATRAAKVIFEVQPALRPVFGDTYAGAQVVTAGDPLPSFDVFCPLMSVAAALGARVESLPKVPMRIQASEARVREWESRLGERHLPRIGLAWSGDSRVLQDRDRRIPLRQLAPLWNLEAEFVSLQRDIRGEDADALAGAPKLRHFGEALRDFGDTAALIELCDLVITICSAPAHLAGAMAKPVTVLLSYVADGRWLLDRRDTLWYDSMTLIRQPQPGDWSTVVDIAVREISGYLHTRHHRPET